MYSLRQLYLGVWFVFQFCVVALVSFFITALLSLRYDEMHTVSTAMDPDPSLTREQVISNVQTYTLGWSVGFTILAIIIFSINYALLESMDEIKGKKAAAIFALICWLWMMMLLLYAGIHCYLKYGANLLQ